MVENLGDLIKNRKRAMDLFRLDENSPVDKIKKSYRKLALINHPDKNLENQNSSNQRMAEINYLYHLLMGGESEEEIYAKRFYEGFVI